MNIRILIAVTLSLAPTLADAGSATWDQNPSSSDWNTAANWTPMTVPNGATDIATFGASNTTNVSISANTRADSITFTSAAPDNYVITVTPGAVLTMSGTGITNNSGFTQTLVASSGQSAGAEILFTNSANAGGTHLFISDSNASVQFSNTSTAGSATIDNGGSLQFSNSATAGGATISQFGGGTNFFDSSTAGNATVGFEGVSNSISFYDNSTAGNATLAPRSLNFFNHSTAGNAGLSTDSPSGDIGFSDFSTAGNAGIAGSGTQILFSGFSDGGTAAMGLFLQPAFGIPSSLDISGHNVPGVTIGSLEGDETGSVFLGGNNLTVGSNDLSTTFAGVIQDSGGISKIGTGTLTLSGTNTYTGSTNVNGGWLEVDGSIASKTIVSACGILSGTGTVNGDVTNNGTISPGGGSTSQLNLNGNLQLNTSSTLWFEIGGPNPGSDYDVLNNSSNTGLVLNGKLAVRLINNFTPQQTDIFTIITTSMALSGAFTDVPSGGRLITSNGTGSFQVTYSRSNNVILSNFQPGVVLTRCASRKTHGSVGSFDIDLPLDGPAGIECRSGGPTGDYELVFTFAHPLNSVGGVSVAGCAASVSNSNVDPADNHNYIVSLSGVANAQVLTVSLADVADSVGNFVPSISAKMAVLIADANADGFVDSVDTAQTKSKSGQAISSSNFREDVNADGFIDAVDVALVKSKSGTAIPSTTSSTSPSRSTIDRSGGRAGIAKSPLRRVRRNSAQNR